MKLYCPRDTVIAIVVFLFCNMLRDIAKTAAGETTPLVAGHFFQNMPRVIVLRLSNGTERYQSMHSSTVSERYSGCSHVTLPVTRDNISHAIFIGTHVLSDS